MYVFARPCWVQTHPPKWSNQGKQHFSFNHVAKWEEPFSPWTFKSATERRVDDLLQKNKQTQNSGWYYRQMNENKQGKCCVRKTGNWSNRCTDSSPVIPQLLGLIYFQLRHTEEWSCGRLLQAGEQLADRNPPPPPHPHHHLLGSAVSRGETCSRRRDWQLLAGVLQTASRSRLVIHKIVSQPQSLCHHSED